MPANLLKQPLVHFLLIGGLIFIAYGISNEPGADALDAAGEPDNRIVVDKTALLNFMQYQAQAFDPVQFAARYAELDDAGIAALVLDYVREEALYREALRMNLDEGDYIIRQRLVQKVEFLLESLAAESIAPTDSELQAFYQDHLQDYQVDAVYSFTHIFFDSRKDGVEAARARAVALLAQAGGIAAESAPDHGDSFPFLQDYTERTRDFIVNNFSAEFVAALDALMPEETRWQGPVASRYGWHLVQLRSRTEPYTPQLQQISAQVLDDYRYEILLRNRQEAEERVVAEYDVTVNLEGQ